MIINSNNPGECCVDCRRDAEGVGPYSAGCYMNYQGCCHSSAPKDTQSSNYVRVLPGGHCYFCHEDYADTHDISDCRKLNEANYRDHCDERCKGSRFYAPPPTGAQEGWREKAIARYEEHADVHTETNFTALMRALEVAQQAIIAAEARGKEDEATLHHWYDLGAAAHHKKVVEEMTRIAELYRKADFGLDDEILRHLLAALTTIDPNKQK